MPKRKRDQAEDIIDNIQDRAVRIKASRLKARVDQGNKSLKDALNLARGFERQKLGRRQKQASSEPHTLLRLREEVIVLKELDIGKTAKDYLFKQLIRTKRIRESAAFVALYGDETKSAPPKSAAEANVQGRLFKTNPVKEVLPGIMDGIKQVLNLKDSGLAKETDQTQPTNGEPHNARSNIPVSQYMNYDDDFAGFSDDDHETAEMGINGSLTLTDDEDEDEMKAFTDRIADSSTDSEDDDDRQLDPMQISDAECSDSESQDPVSTPESEVSFEPMRAQRPSTSDRKVSSTAFLPSLSMGGYYSGSESNSDADDFNDHNCGPPMPDPRKNRRGQRARQRIAELKFGQNAKHLQKPQQVKNGRNAGWDAKRGAVDSNDQNRKQNRFGRGSLVRATGPTGSNGEPLARDRNGKRAGSGTSKNSNTPLHPSWEAAKKKKQESSGAAFTGTKITFD